MRATTRSGGTLARQQMIATIDMKGLSVGTQDNYLHTVSAPAMLYDRPLRPCQHLRSFDLHWPLQ